MIYEKLTISMENRRMRLDRILFKSKELGVKSMKLFGNEPIYQKKNKNFGLDLILFKVDF